MEKLYGLEPKKVFKYFEEISQFQEEVETKKQ